VSRTSTLCGLPWEKNGLKICLKEHSGSSERNFRKSFKKTPRVEKSAGVQGLRNGRENDRGYLPRGKGNTLPGRTSISDGSAGGNWLARAVHKHNRCLKRRRATLGADVPSQWESKDDALKKKDFNPPSRKRAWL